MLKGLSSSRISWSNKARKQHRCHSESPLISLHTRLSTLAKQSIWLIIYRREKRVYALWHLVLITFIHILFSVRHFMTVTFNILVIFQKGRHWLSILQWIFHISVSSEMNNGALKLCRKDHIYESNAHERHHKVIIMSEKQWQKQIVFSHDKFISECWQYNVVCMLYVYC